MYEVLLEREGGREGEREREREEREGGAHTHTHTHTHFLVLSFTRAPRT